VSKVGVGGEGSLSRAVGWVCKCVSLEGLGPGRAIDEKNSWSASTHLGADIVEQVAVILGSAVQD
jgi:hypothetical protein